MDTKEYAELEEIAGRFEAGQTNARSDLLRLYRSPHLSLLLGIGETIRLHRALLESRPVLADYLAANFHASNYRGEDPQRFD